MKTRTLLLLSVGTALMILIAGGALLYQLDNRDDTIRPTPLGQLAEVGDARVTIFGSTTVGDILRVDAEIGGVDDADGIESFSLVTGDRRLTPVLGPAGEDVSDRCGAITVDTQRCTVDFDVSAVEASNRLLTVRRGEERAAWEL